MTHLPTRRRALLAGAACAIARPGHAATARDDHRPLAIGQLFDSSPAEQDVARDFLVGARAAWQDINSRGGLRGRPVQHLAIDVDGSAGSLRRASLSLLANEACVALCGTAGDALGPAGGAPLPRGAGQAVR